MADTPAIELVHMIEPKVIYGAPATEIVALLLANSDVVLRALGMEKCDTDCGEHYDDKHWSVV